MPHPGQSWQPHEYVRNGTAKLLTLFHPASGHIRVEGATTCPNEVLHGWLKRELTEVLAALPELPPRSQRRAQTLQDGEHAITLRVLRGAPRARTRSCGTLSL